MLEAATKEIPIRKLDSGDSVDRSNLELLGSEVLHWDVYAALMTIAQGDESSRASSYELRRAERIVLGSIHIPRKPNRSLPNFFELGKQRPLPKNSPPAYANFVTVDFYVHKE